MTNDLSDTITPDFKHRIEKFLTEMRGELEHCNDPRPKMPSDFIWKYAPMISIHRNVPIEDAIEITKEMYDTLEETITRF